MSACLILCIIYYKCYFKKSIKSQYDHLKIPFSTVKNCLRKLLFFFRFSLSKIIKIMCWFSKDFFLFIILLLIFQPHLKLIISDNRSFVFCLFPLLKSQIVVVITHTGLGNKISPIKLHFNRDRCPDLPPPPRSWSHLQDIFRHIYHIPSQLQQFPKASTSYMVVIGFSKSPKHVIVAGLKECNILTQLVTWKSFKIHLQITYKWRYIKLKAYKHFTILIIILMT